MINFVINFYSTTSIFNFLFMLKYITLGVLLFAFITCRTSQTETSKSSVKITEKTYEITDATATFKQFCTSCHGADAFVFADREWKHGKTKTDLVNSITAGFPNLGMPKWSPALKPEMIAALADYILVGIEKRTSFDFEEKPKSNTFTDGSVSLRLDTIASGGVPWGMTFLPDGNSLLTDKMGNLFLIDKNKQKKKILGVPKVNAEGQGGLMDVELHPKYAENKLIYLTYSKIKEEGSDLSTTAVLRAQLNGIQLTEQKDIFVAQPYLTTRYHYGSRLEFDKQGFLYVSVGDRGQHEDNLPQLLDNDLGKIHRIKDDGSIPNDNPFVKTLNAKGSIWSYGHRNPQGMSMNPSTGEMWVDEHGPRGGDEVNISQKGKNYGWPVISYGINYDGSVLTPFTKKENLEQPLIYWVPSIAPCGATFVTGDRYKAWKGNLLVSSLRFKYLNLCKIEGNSIVTQENLLKNIGRMRFVEMGLDGYIYVGVEEPGFVYRLMPL
jgi:aldose sugar dehydrogenase